MTVTIAEDWQPVVTDDAASPFRRRLLDGLEMSIHERGYRDTTVADIVRHARTSKRTFYEQFASKEDCLIELLRRNSELASAAIRGLQDAQLDRAAPISLNADAPLTCQFFLEDHAVRHSYHHHARIRAALK